MLKTFWNGPHGWRDRQLPDGTVVWTSPPGTPTPRIRAASICSRQLCEPTATLWTGEPPTAEITDDRGVMMPKRRHTRAHNTATAIAAERRLNDALVAERNQTTTASEPDPLHERDGEEMPLAGHALELVSAALLELEP